ncbi:MAG: response regulator [Firmicutes bacterium]|nr:response regulator [Bacillota bacterium]
MARILVVDDDPGIGSVLQEALELEGHSVVTACNGLVAMGYLSPDPLPDIVLADVMMPVMNGKELIEKIRAEPRTANLPVILVTGASPGSKGFPHPGTYDALVSKPFDIWDVTECIDSLLTPSLPQTNHL